MKIPFTPWTLRPPEDLNLHLVRHLPICIINKFTYNYMKIQIIIRNTVNYFLFFTYPKRVFTYNTILLYFTKLNTSLYWNLKCFIGSCDSCTLLYWLYSLISYMWLISYSFGFCNSVRIEGRKINDIWLRMTA